MTQQAERMKYCKYIVFVVILLLLGFFFYEKFPVMVRLENGEAGSLEKILLSCGKASFLRDIPFAAGDSFYIYRRQYSAWSLTAWGKIKGDIDQGLIDKLWKNHDAFHDPTLGDFPETVLNKYRAVFERDENDGGKNADYIMTGSGSTVSLRISPDGHYYHLLIWHR